MPAWFLVPLLALAIAWLSSSRATAQPRAPLAPGGGNLFAAEAHASDGGGDQPAVFLATDRVRERQLDRARRLAAEDRWSDAAAACDELLADDKDAFIDAAAGDTTSRSIRSEAAAVVTGFPRPGREAYLLMFRGRAEKRLAEAVAAADQDGVVAVARRWPATPAGRQAAILTAITALEADQPLLAAAWLERVVATGEADEFEPTLTVMRALALQRAGDAEAAEKLLAAAAGGRSVVRLAGQDAVLSAAGGRGGEWLAEQFGRPSGTDPTTSGQAAPAAPRPAAGDWRQPRGSPARNAVVEASRPLLVPRYRVPLVRHPEEAKRLEQRRRVAADAGTPLLPAGGPLAVGEFLVVQTPVGILAVHFETGKRVWLESTVAVAEPDAADTDAGGGRVFDDATSGNLSSDGRLVFAVEVPPAALVAAEPMVAGLGRGFAGPPSSWTGGNTLTALDLAAGGEIRWRLPDRGAGRDQQGGPEAEADPWFLSAPLVVGDELFLLVEEGGEVRLEARAAADGRLRWQQPLATYDEQETITTAEARGRRLAGLAPALAEGVLVCPLGGGCVVALDIATRSLLWAHSYARSAVTDETDARGTGRPLGEPCPVIAGGRVLLTPFDGEGLLCLGLRDGEPAWPEPRRGRVRVAGVAGSRVIVVGDAAVECLDLATGRREWRRSLADIGRPSGRGVLTPATLLLPLDTPEVIEISLADGGIRHRAAARGGGVPGNLVAYRGELISRGVDSLDVFHQETALESRIETAARAEPASPWAGFWRGQLAIEGGDVERGLDLVAAAVGSSAIRLPPGVMADTVVRALERDFPAASRRPETIAAAGRSAEVSRRLVDGFLAAGDGGLAWEACRPLLEADFTTGDDLLTDPIDRSLAVTADRWLQGRLARILALADGPLRARIDEACRAVVAAAAAEPLPAARLRILEALAERLGRHEAAADCRRQLAAAEFDGNRPAAIRIALVELAAAGPAGRPAAAGHDAAATDDTWPLGRVQRSRLAGDHGGRAGVGRMQPLPLPLAGSGQWNTPLLQATLDGNQRLLVVDRFGRPVTEPLTIEGVGPEAVLPWGHRTSAVEAAVLGRLLFVRTRQGLSAYDLESAPGRGRGLWRRPDLAAFGAAAVEARLAGGIGGRVARDGAIPLGTWIGEPEDAPRGDGRGLVAVPGGVVVPGPRSVAVVDPATGRLAWERRRLPPGLEWCVDDEFLCGLTSDGHGSVVLSSVDGRRLHTFDVPHRRQRLATLGRRVATVRSIDELPGRFTARRVRIDLVDAAAREVRPLGEFDGEARATEAGPGRLAVMEPGGAFTMLDLAAGDVAFRTRLPDPPRQFARLAVHAWQDRCLVFAGAPDDVEDALDVSPLQHLMLASPAAEALSGRLWAIDRMDGRPVWPAPALIERHCLHPTQPAGLPVLTFCRILQDRGERQTATLGLLVLDKRTGHAVLEDDRIPIQNSAFVGCEIVGHAERRQITFTDPFGGVMQTAITFTGEPLAPQPPFRSRAARAGGGRVLDGLHAEPGEQAPGPRRRPDPGFFDPEAFE